MANDECLTAEFGPYLLTTKLSTGGMAELFLATRVGNSHLQQQVALKRMLPHLSREPEFVTMFLDEARVASRLSHPNLVQVIDFGEVRGEYYLAMEYLPGETLDGVLQVAAEQRRPVPLAVALQVVSAVCDGLHYAHEYAEGGKPLGLVHRDISPSNVMVTFHGGVKVLDFGIAWSSQRAQEETRAGVVKGKIPYCSPEQLEGRRLDRRSDVFSVGTLLHELLVGKGGFRRDSDYLTSRAVVEEQLPPVSRLRPELPRELDTIVAKAMAKRPEERFATCLELRRALERLQQGPSVRLDEYLTGLFGQERMTTRVAPQQTPSAPRPLPRPSTQGVPTATMLLSPGSTPSQGTRSPLAPAHTPTQGTRAPLKPPGATPAAGTPVATKKTGPCPHAATCPLFPQFSLVSLLSVWKLTYCDADYAKCRRYQLSLEGKPVSLAMLPNGTMLTAPKKR